MSTLNNQDIVDQDLIQGFTKNLSEFVKKSSPTKLDKLRKISSILDNKSFCHSNNDQQFMRRTIEAISNTKKQIMMLLSSSSQFQFSQTINYVLDVFRELNMSPKVVLKSGIIKCYQNIILIEQQDEQMQNNRFFYSLKNVLQQLVRFSIIYNQYQKRVHKLQLQTQKRQASQSKINQKLIKQIQTQIFKKQFYDLVIHYLNSEKIKLKRIKEICRICEIKIRIQQMGSHLECCKRRYYQLQQLQDNSTNLLQLQKQIQQVEKSVSLIQQKEKYKRILQKIDNICLSKYHQKSQITSIILENDQNFQVQHSLIVTYKRLIKQRVQIIETISFINKESLIQDPFQMLQVNSFIKDRKEYKSTQTDDINSIDNNWTQQEGESHISIQSSIHKSFQQDQSSQDKDKYRNKKVETLNTEETNMENKDKKTVRWNLKRAMSMNRSFKDFQVIKFLGKGAFGKVYLVRRVLTNDYYAVKCIKMDNNLLQDEKKIQNLKNQHDIFRKISGEFLVKAAFSFSEGSMHMFFLQYMPGGDFGALLEQQGYLEQQVAKFYLAEIVLAIEHLHNINIIHRDLKPQNLVFDQKGHLKLTDFGLSKEGITKKLLITKQKASSQVKQDFDEVLEIKKSNSSSSNKRKTLVKRIGRSSSNRSIVGTPDYIAPQVLNGISTQNQSIDWWSFGVIAYEVLIGQKPFGAQSIEKVFSNIKNNMIQWPPVGYEQDCITPQAYDFIKSLLNIDFSQRLGAQSIDQIKSHAFFQGICWQKLKQMNPPIAAKNSKDQYSFQDINLRCQIQQQINDIPSQLSQKILLDDYMRVDLLLETTLHHKEKMVHSIKQKQTKISYLYKKCVGAAKSMQQVFLS